MTHCFSVISEAYFIQLFCQIRSTQEEQNLDCLVSGGREGTAGFGLLSAVRHGAEGVL